MKERKKDDQSHLVQCSKWVMSEVVDLLFGQRATVGG